MINIQELRIGNYLFNKGQLICTVNGIYRRDHISVKESYLESIHIENFEPIKLTTEILEKCGFEKIDFDYFELKTEENYYCHIDELGFGFALEHETFYICEYVHEIQNLYFALTGKEITIKF